MSNYLLLLLLLACPLMMMWMMRGGHGGHAGEGHTHGAAGGHGGHDDVDATAEPSLDDLRRQRDELDNEISKREAEEQTYAWGSRR
jgi:hypothetical protein